MKVLITGSEGQLAREFRRRLSGGAYEVFAPSEDELDISNTGDVKRAFDKACPDLVFNCAAYNNVDGAEGDYDTAYRVNAIGPKILAAACRESKALFVHFSTDYVFDGKKEGFYTEDDAVCPINRYGESKRAGEIFVAEQAGRYLIFRTSWLYGTGKQNFLNKLMEWAGRQHVLRVVADQVSVPTYTVDVVDAVMTACYRSLNGLYHLANSGYAARYEVARYFFEKAGIDCLVLPVNSSVFPSPASRPYFSAMSSSRLTAKIGRDIPHWKNAIDRFIGDAGLRGVEL
jgi:dTDP-4-dehydrorhamnose reductase